MKLLCSIYTFLDNVEKTAIYLKICKYIPVLQDIFYHDIFLTKIFHNQRIKSPKSIEKYHKKAIFSSGNVGLVFLPVF